MSELINNKKKKQEKLKEIIKRLHQGESVEDVKADFDKLTIGVSPTEITEMEQDLVNEGLPISEIQRLCDVHASVFKGSIEDIHKDEAAPPQLSEWHPANVIKKENREIEKLTADVLTSLEANHKDNLLLALKNLADIDIHYSRKENLIFPYMESHNITAPPQVMWGVDDEIRQQIKDVTNWVMSASDISSLSTEINELTTKITEMVFKEEEIMLPMVMDVFTEGEWKSISESSSEIGFVYIGEVQPWVSDNLVSEVKESISMPSSDKYVAADSDSRISFDAGSLTSKEINSILNTIPFDMTFVGADNRVKYFTQGKERIFARALTVIGRDVKNCHPPSSVHIVEKIVEDLRSGRKDHEDFWIRMGEQFIHIRYFAVRDKDSNYLGTLEVSQNIKPIVELEGEKRLVED